MGRESHNSTIQMKTTKVIAPAIIFGALSLVSGSAFANTYVRTTSWLMTEGKETCLSKAVEVAKKTGFTENHFTGTADDKSSSNFYADSKHGPYSLTVFCNKDSGTASLAVSGISYDGTNQIWDKVIDAY